jgi:hypothetical protein
MYLWFKWLVHVSSPLIRGVYKSTVSQPLSQPSMLFFPEFSTQSHVIESMHHWMKVGKSKWRETPQGWRTSGYHWKGALFSFGGTTCTMYIVLSGPAPRVHISFGESHQSHSPAGYGFMWFLKSSQILYDCTGKTWYSSQRYTTWFILITEWHAGRSTL